MTRFITILLVASLALVAVAYARQDRGAPPVTFRSSVDAIQLDVSVLDGHRHPVQGLTAADFTVLEDGKPRPIRSFEAVEVPPRVAPSGAWMRDVAPDVVTNAPLKGRVLGIVIDDGSLRQNGGLWGVQKTRAIAKAAIDELGAEDIATVVFTMYNHSAQGFTRDRQRLLNAIDAASIMPRCEPGSPNCDFSQTGWCYCGECSVEALERVAAALVSFPDRRKTLLYISTGVGLASGVAEGLQSGLPAAFSSVGAACDGRKTDWVIKALRQASLGNVAVQAIDPNGLCGSDCTSFPETLKAIAQATGGRAVVQNNDAEREVPALFVESSAYYLLGVETSVTRDDGRFHLIEVRVDRPGVTVETRHGYVAPTAKERAAMTAAGNSTNPDGAIAGAVPRSDIPLEVSAAPFAAGGKGRAAVELVLAVRRPAGDVATVLNGRLDVVASAFGEENGTFYGTRHQTLNLAVNPARNTDTLLEVLSSLPLKPGRYELRLGVKAADGRMGSVYTYADVPDFAAEALSLSGLVIAARNTPLAAPADAFAGVLPVVPTARRAFQRTEDARAFVRIYEGGSKPVVPATVTATIVDAGDREVVNKATAIAGTAFGTSRAADYTFDLPLASLSPGEYLLRIHVAAGQAASERTVRLTVQ
jgi:VWFA-related protein